MHCQWSYHWFYKEGLQLSDNHVSGFLFADDIVLVSAGTDDALKTLFPIVRLLLEVNTWEGKTEVVCPTDDLWALLLDLRGSSQKLRRIFLGCC